MTTLTKRERVDAALNGRTVDRPPVSAWQHFIPAERDATSLAEAHLRFFDTYDWDWLKVNPRATCYSEAWGNRYDFDSYDSVLPRLVQPAITSPSDLAQLRPVSATAGVFAEQLDLLGKIKRGIGDAPFVQTVFSPLSVLAFLTTHSGDQTIELGLQSNFDGVRELLRAHPAEAHQALAAISETLAGYAAASIAAGADGIFFAIVRLARAGALSLEEYTTFGLPYDLRVLKGAQHAPFNQLHICGPQAYFELLRDYPVRAINWAAVGQHNPSLAQARALTDIALMGGLDEAGAILHGTPDDVIAEARAAIHAAGTRNLLLSPGCGIADTVPAANLRALRQAAENKEQRTR